jgi:hypothetical protein
LVDDFPDELNQRRVQNSEVLLEESDREGERMECGVDGDDLKSDGLHHPRGRIIRKAKRPTKATSFSEPRNSLGRGPPKKGCAGGKGTWNKLGMR